MSIKVLQISDLHIGNSMMNTNELVYSINLALQNNPVDLIIFTGDLIDGNCLDSEFQKLRLESKEFFDALLKTINQDQKKYLTKNDILFVPGNHEIDRNNATDPFRRYKSFLEFFYDKIPDFYDEETLCVFKPVEDSKIVFLGFNSAHYDAKNDKDYGHISTKQIQKVVRKLNGIPNINEYNVIPFLHHHFYLVEEREKQTDDNNYLKNSETFLNNLKSYNISLILHGHKHRNIDRRIVISSLNEADKISTVIGCGSLAKKDTPYNAFNYIEVFSKNDRLQLIYSEYKYETSTFKNETTIKLPLYETKPNEKSLLNYLEEDADLYNRYIDLKNIDTVTRANDIIDIFNKTVGSLNLATKNLYEDKNCIVNLFIAMHYRSNKNSDKNFTSKIKDFIRKYIKYDYDIEKIINILELDNIYLLDAQSKPVLKDLSDIERKRFTFLLIGFFISEMYLTLKENGEEFFNLKIKSKCDFGIEQNSLNENIKGNNIKILADEDRRALAIEIVCTNAQAHKMITLIIKEFEILLTPFEEHFAKVGFKIYYISPTLNKFLNENKIELESYTFGTYLPTLIPLLAGDRLYSQAETFTRELIQNSIDAITLRKELSKEFVEDGKIEIAISQKNGIKSFEISDNGVGMNKYILERYFTTIGRSFYRSDDYDRLKVNINAISNFGIGFLSCFLVGKKIEVKTRYFEDKDGEEQGFWLDIPNYDGCFFIERTNKENCGTKITVYEDVDNDKKNFDANKILTYIEKNVLNIKYDLVIANKILKTKKIIKRNNFIENLIINTHENKLLFFIPFNPQSNSFDKKTSIADLYNDADFRRSNSYGIFIYKEDKKLYERQNVILSNAGILVNKIEKIMKSVIDLVGDYFDVYINLPSNIIDLDVSRNEIVENSPLIQMLGDSSIKSYLEKQYMNYTKSFSKESEKVPYILVSYLAKLDFSKKIGVSFVDNSIKIGLVSDNKDVNYYQSLKDFFSILNASKNYKSVFVSHQRLDEYMRYFNVSHRTMRYIIDDRLIHGSEFPARKEPKKAFKNYIDRIYNELGSFMSHSNPKNWLIAKEGFDNLSQNDYVTIQFLSLLFRYYSFPNESKSSEITEAAIDAILRALTPSICAICSLDQLKKGITINLEEIFHKNEKTIVGTSD